MTVLRIKHTKCICLTQNTRSCPISFLCSGTDREILRERESRMESNVRPPTGPPNSLKLKRGGRGKRPLSSPAMSATSRTTSRGVPCTALDAHAQSNPTPIRERDGGGRRSHRRQAPDGHDSERRRRGSQTSGLFLAQQILDAIVPFRSPPILTLIQTLTTIHKSSVQHFFFLGRSC